MGDNAGARKTSPRKGIAHMRIIGTVVAIIIALGVAWGVAQWLGDDAPILSEAWFTNMQNKMQSLSDMGKDAGDRLPDPNQMDMPAIPDPNTIPQEAQ